VSLFLCYCYFFSIPRFGCRALRASHVLFTFFSIFSPNPLWPYVICGIGPSFPFIRAQIVRLVQGHEGNYSVSVEEKKGAVERIGEGWGYFQIAQNTSISRDLEITLII